jgi:nitrogen fixation NifU-like protein
MNQSPYTENLLKHYKNPVLFDDVGVMQYVVEHRNRSCGDRVILGINIDAKARRIVGIRHESDGCMLCKASASILCQSLEGVTLASAKNLHDFVVRICDLEVPESELDFGIVFGERLSAENLTNDLRALMEIRTFPTRKRCFTLPWEALDELMKKLSTKTQ